MDNKGDGVKGLSASSQLEVSEEALMREEREAGDERGPIRQEFSYPVVLSDDFVIPVDRSFPASPHVPDLVLGIDS